MQNVKRLSWWEPRFAIASEKEQPFRPLDGRTARTPEAVLNSALLVSRETEYFTKEADCPSFLESTCFKRCFLLKALDVESAAMPPLIDHASPVSNRDATA